MLRCIDLETTGTDPKVHDIIEIASVDITKDGFANPITQFVLLPSGKSIPPESSAVHHLIEEDITNGIALPDALNRFIGADWYLAHNAPFEQSFLPPAWRFVCTYKAALRVWPDAPGHSLQTLRYWLKLIHPLGTMRTKIDPHRALSDVIVTAAVFHEMLKAGAKWGQLVQWSSEPPVHKWCRFGNKHRNKTFAEIASADPSYLTWIIDKSEMDDGIKHSARVALEHRGEAA